MAARIADINPQCRLELYTQVFSADNAGDFALDKADYVIDAIDSIRNKLDLIEMSSRIHDETGKACLFSSMGTACKLDPTQLKVGDVWKTQGCPLARYVRQGLRKRGFKGHFKVVYSGEQVPQDKSIPVSCGTGACLCHLRIDSSGHFEGAATGQDKHASGEAVEWCSKKAVINGSAMPVTATAGMILASLVIRDALYRQPVQTPAEQAGPAGV
jgi:tRNA A37 threonylcarbamoyladenosine dehydratase